MAFLTSSKTARMLLLGILLSRWCAAQVFNEYQVKAAFLNTLTRFVEWPAQSFSGPSAELVICILGTDPFGNYLDDAVRGKVVEGHPLAVRRLADRPAAGECHILFIAASEPARMRSLLTSLPAPRLLTVGDTVDFAAQGGIVGLRLEGDHIGLIVNLTAADRAKLKVSSRVLSLATVIR
jgi:YfiR/HmsC-like